jgi:hypothetical protein
MKNPIISELRRIRDAHAKKCNYDLDIMAIDWMNLNRWEKAKTVKLQRGRIVPAFPRRKAATPSARRKNNATHK